MCTLDTYFNDQHTVMRFPGLVKCLIIPKSEDRLLWVSYRKSELLAYVVYRDTFAHFGLPLLPVMKDKQKPSLYI